MNPSQLLDEISANLGWVWRNSKQFYGCRWKPGSTQQFKWTWNSRAISRGLNPSKPKQSNDSQGPLEALSTLSWQKLSTDFVLYYSKMVSEKIKKDFLNGLCGRSILFRGKTKEFQAFLPLHNFFSEKKIRIFNYYDNYAKRLVIRHTSKWLFLNSKYYQDRVIGRGGHSFL